MKRWIHSAKTVVEASWEFWHWYENLCPCAKEAVDKIAGIMNLPDYLECSDDELDRLYCFYTTQKRMVRRRFMPMAASTIIASINSLTEAQEELKYYDKEKVDFVKDCRDALNMDIYNNLDEYREDEDLAEANLSAIKEDYIQKAVDEDIMSEEEFEEIFALFDAIDIEWSEL